MKIFLNKELACGLKKPRLLRDQLAHYRECAHDDCKRRLRSWEVILERLKAGKPQHGEDFQ